MFNCRMARILVTGGAGYIGSHVTKDLLEKGHQVLVFDNLTTGFDFLVDPKARLFRGDLRVITDIETAFKEFQPEAIIHFAARTEVAKSLQEPLNFYQNNFGGSVNLLRVATANKVKHFIFSSTAAVYADPVGALVEETSKLEPATPYGKSKLMFEKVLADTRTAQAFAGAEFSYVVLRYFNVGGARRDLSVGQTGRTHSALIKRTAEAACGFNPAMEIYGTDYPTVDGTGVRDYIHVDDLAELHVLAYQYLCGGGLSETLNCGYGRGYSVGQVIEAMQKVSGVQFSILKKPRREGDLPEVVAKATRVREILGWTPKFDNLEIICRSTFEWEKKSAEILKGRS
jgi:UDP-glucose 4-epimerase